MQKKKVCFVLPVHTSYTIGGAQFQAECLMNHIIELGNHDVAYITNLSDPNFTPSNYELVTINTNYQKQNTVNLVKSSKRLMDALKRFKPDIIYQRIACYQTAICAYYAKSYNCSFLFHIASDMDVAPFRFKLGRNPIYTTLDKKMQLYGIKNATKIIAQTHHQNENLQHYLKRIADAVVYNFHPVPTSIAEKSPTIQIVWVANVKKIKRPDIFIRLAKDLHVQTGAQFIMVGKMQGRNRWCKNIKKRIEQTKGLNYLGPVSQNTVNSLLDQSHLLVNTSSVEGFSNTFIQAWMRKVPVVSLHVDPDNLLQVKQIGRLSGGYEKLKADVKELVDNGYLREQMGQRAFNYSIENHSFKNIQKIIDLF